ncbi:cytidine deaminase-like protein [Phlebopus sp. FC_14]|nr:cytidine deaminase-like protein [Phlebopus sp. FC_14]
MCPSESVRNTTVTTAAQVDYLGHRSTVMELKDVDELGFSTALAKARKSYEEGGVPIGAALVYLGSSNGNYRMLGSGHNERIQKSLPTLHAEIAALNDAGLLSPDIYAQSTLLYQYTTLSPCSMCAGAILFYKIPRVVVGENVSVSTGEEELLKSRGVEVVVLDDQKCKELMASFMKNNLQGLQGSQHGGDVVR